MGRVYANTSKSVVVVHFRLRTVFSCGFTFIAGKKRT